MTAPTEAPHGALETEARGLADSHGLSDHPPRSIAALSRLRNVPDWLAGARAALGDAEGAVAKAAEWLLDNDYLVARGVRQVQKDLPRGFYARLPTLGGADAGRARIWSIARALLRASRLQLSVPTVTRFLDAYQERTPLTIAELWALPTFLRLGCLEVLFAAFERLDRSLSPPFPIDDLPDIALEDTECVGRAISNLRTIASISWKDFFCRTSRVEAILREDPTHAYRRMDFETRDAYRRAIEELARRSPHSELEIAERAVACARQAAGGPLRRTDVGYWLVDEGLEEFERSIGCRPRLRTRASRWLFRHAAILYATALVAATAATIVVPAWHLTTHGTTPLATVLILLVVLLPASTLAITCVLWLVTMLAPPRMLPKLDFETAIPDECRTAVVMPTLVGSVQDARSQLEHLELHYLANPDQAAQFVLLSDFPDASNEHEPTDQGILTSLVGGARRLNQKYPSKPFHVLHRPRRFNAAEGVWMAWERKRGKIEEFNRLLAGDPATSFSLHEGDRTHLDGVRYVVTLDVDTILPKGAVARLVGTLAHPLNRAEFDEVSGRVRTGYTVLQPRVEISPECGNRSQFARWFTGDTTIDIYSHAVSDVYQDLFGSGIYVGKGAYDVEAFRRSLDGRVPENALASHDLFEGVHGRAALATDIVLYETFPRQYLEFARRQHRWIRGDWQLLPWLGRSVPGAGGRLRNRLTWIDRWKIVDNLRRSLLPPALVTMLVAGWLVLPGHPALWTLLGVLAPSGQIVTDLVTGFARGRRRSAVSGTFQRLSDHAGRWLLLLVFLPHDAAVAADAIARTLVRIFFTRRHLLQWTSAARTSEELAAGDTRRFIWRQMRIAPVLAVVVLVAVMAFQAQALPGALPLLVMWFIAPEVAYVLGHPRRPPGRRLDADDRTLLRRIARRTWRYFEVFAGPEDQWLPPDNFQEQPRGVVAHRTSPTNVGMMFLSSLAACDLGYVGLDDLASRLTNSLDTLARADRYRGHLFNWYDTRTLEPLNPRYVSTVDSGNLAVSLLALKEGCLELADGPALRSQQWRGLSDVLRLLDDAVERLDLGREEARGLRGCLDAIETRVMEVENEPGRWWPTLRDLSDRDVPDLDRRLLDAVAETEGHPATLARVREVRTWLERVHHHVRSMDRECRSLFPWLLPLTQAPPALAGLATRVATAVPPSLRLGEFADHCRQARDLIKQPVAAERPEHDEALLAWRTVLADALDRGERDAAALRASLVEIATRAENLALSMDFGLLYDKDLRLFHIGYNVTADRVDSHHYDLLASEARLASLFAIAKGDAPVEHWFHLGRATTMVGHDHCLLSWGGSMFEYLMPRLLVRSEAGSLLAESARAAIDAQRRYGRTLGVPWGMSESGLSATDSDQAYQYRSFGVPALGLRRGLATETVVAPYATALALSVDAGAALENLRRLEELGLLGDYGFYEAADFTPDRTPAGSLFVPVLSYMAHHQGMTLAALDNALCDDAIVRRAEADRRLRSVSLLLHERVPVDVPAEPTSAAEIKPRRAGARSIPRIEPWTPVKGGAFPEIQLLGNGRLASWISDSGAGALRWQNWNLTRWAADPTRDDTGLWMYVRDEATGALSSVARQPCGAAPDAVDVVFYPHLAEFHRRDGDLAMRVEVVVAPADDIEIRHVTLINDGDQVKRLTITTCAEVVLARAADHERHPAFSKLFVHGEFIPPLDGLLFQRQPRSPDERPPVLFHRLVSDDPNVRVRGTETDRAAFVGRGRTYRDPVGAVRTGCVASGFTLDPILALQVSATIEPSASVRLAFITAVSGSRESVLELAERYQTMNAVDWVMAEAEDEASRELQHFGIEPGRMTEMQTLASLLVYRHRALRCAAETIAANHLGQPRLWGMGLSGDLPILLMHLRTPDDIDLLRDLARAHAFWKRRGLRFDLMILRHGASGYEEPVGEKLRALLHGLGSRDQLGQHAGIHFLSADHVGEDERRLLEVAANVVLDTDRGTLGLQLARVHEETPALPQFLAGASPEPDAAEAPVLERPAGLLFDNGLGGFSADGREYVIHLGPGGATPVPWSNVLANADFGTLVTESGGGFTWAANSGEHRLTPWTNDPVSDPPGEALYVRDEETASVWTPTPQPAGAGGAHEIRYGAGYARWRSESHGLSQDLLVFVPPDDPVKVVRLRVCNHRHRPRRLTVTYYAEWLLGASRQQSNAVVVTEYDASQRAILARNPWQGEFANRVAFLTASRRPHGITADRTEFLGREGTERCPAALARWGLTGNVQPGRDPCAAFQVHLDLPADAGDDVVFVLGEGRNRGHALELVTRWREPVAADAAWERLGRFWDSRLEVIHVETPDGAMNVMLNRWLLYQAIASRMLGRTGFYQSGGAVGFRDQLQDALALVLVEPGRCRAHLLDCAARQFDEGDVLHWWHPPAARGVRTRCSDDLLWLPFAVAHYVSATGDTAVLDERVRFLKGAPLTGKQDDLYAVFEPGEQSGSLFEHCERALERGLTRGAHGLPLIGSGDWNDGMNRVGRQGRGESVWLAWFAIATANAFAAVCQTRGAADRADRWRRRARELAHAAEEHGWDGEWYRRAFDDEGRPLGSRQNAECRIDSIAQSWAVISGGGSKVRAEGALRAVERELVDAEGRLVRLLTPPFTQTGRDPGYISAYPPGIRENGGQYTHAAVWLGWAFADLGDGERAARVFDLLNPIGQARDAATVQRYRVEPYVVAADVGGVSPYVGRGGWTWYTGSAAWMWRLGIERILGLRPEAGGVRIEPCLPRAWRRVDVTLRRPGGGALVITIENPDGVETGVAGRWVDSVAVEEAVVAFPADGRERRITVRLGAARQSGPPNGADELDSGATSNQRAAVS